MRGRLLGQGGAGWDAGMHMLVAQYQSGTPLTACSPDISGHALVAAWLWPQSYCNCKITRVQMLACMRMQNAKFKTFGFPLD
jgi:hypothetical protein